MSDVPTHGANNAQTGSQNLAQDNTAHARDIEDIDRELEAYLEEKRSGKSVGYHRSVDDQLSHIREKFGSRVTPTKESEKPREVEVVRGSLDDHSVGGKSAPTAQPVPEKREGATTGEKAKVLSHEDLIRSLEEKYSKGESTNVPPKTPEPPKAESSMREKKSATVSSGGLSQLLIDLKESIEPHNQGRVDTLLESAALLSIEEQKLLSESFLARFKRNKERMELYVKTQTELEDALERFVSELSAASRPKESHMIQAEKRTTPARAQSEPEQVNVPAGETSENSAEEKATRQEVAPPTGKEKSPLPERYRNYLAKLEKKPLVLVYDPQNGFVRKPVNPDDPALILTYSFEDATNMAVLTVHDDRGNELGVFKTPEKELDN